MNKTNPLLLTSGLALVAILGCSQDQIQSARVEKTAPATQPTPALPPGHPPLATPPGAAQPGAAQPGAAQPGMTMPGGELPVPPVMQGLKWVLPKGWTSAQAGGMRYATLRPPAGGTTEVSVVMLSGPAGGELANVNRWRAQLGLPPIEEPALAQGRKSVASKAGEVAVFEFANSGNRMIVGLLTTSDGNTWFLKLMGADASVSQAKPDFMKLLGTLSLG